MTRYIFILFIFILNADLYAESLDDYFKQFGKLYQKKSGSDYPIYYSKLDTSYSIPQVVARTYVPISKEEFVRAIRECRDYRDFLPGQSKEHPTICDAPKKDGIFIQTAVMDLPWPVKDLKYKTTVYPFDLSKNILVERWTNIPIPSEREFGQTLENKGSWSIVLPDQRDAEPDPGVRQNTLNHPRKKEYPGDKGSNKKGFFLQYEFLVVPSTKVPNSVKAWLADAALKEIIESIINRANDKDWTLDKKRVITYKKIQVKDLKNL